MKKKKQVFFLVILAVILHLVSYLLFLVKFPERMEFSSIACKAGGYISAGIGNTFLILFISKYIVRQTKNRVKKSEVVLRIIPVVGIIIVLIAWSMVLSYIKRPWDEAFNVFFSLALGIFAAIIYESEDGFDKEINKVI